MARKLRILSIDGGGIRGIIPGRVLVKLEEKLQTKSGNSQARITDHFDLVAGTSTGGILGCLLLCPDGTSAAAPSARPKYSAREALNLYVERGADIFDAPVWHRASTGFGLLDEKYPAAGIEQAARDYFADVQLKDLLKPCLVTAYDIENRRAHFFTQHDAGKDGKNFFVRDVVRATSAAPTFFECARIQSNSGVSYTLVDGGVFANNPALCAYAEARRGLALALELEPAPTAVDMRILSLGTGELTRKYPYEAARNWGVAGWIRPVLDIMMAGVSETVDYQLARIYEAVGAPAQYLRIQPELPEAQEDMDNAERDNVERLLQIGARIAEEKDAELDDFAEQLLSN